MHEYNINPLYPTHTPPSGLLPKPYADERYYSWLGPYLCAPLCVSVPSIMRVCVCLYMCVLYQYTLNFDILPSFSRNSVQCATAQMHQKRLHSACIRAWCIGCINCSSARTVAPTRRKL